MPDLNLAAAASRTTMPCPPAKTVWVAIARRGITAHTVPAGPPTQLPERTDCGRTVRVERDNGGWTYGQTLTAAEAADQLQAAWCRKCNWTGEPTK